MARMALLKANTGLRKQEVWDWDWDWEFRLPQLGTSVFIVPAELVKHREDH